MHVIGAAPPECAAPAQWWATALGELRGRERGEDAGVFVAMIGPQVPRGKETRFGRGVVITYERGPYEAQERTPSLVVGFNMGLTDAGYDWSAALKTVPEGTPFVAFAHSQLEMKREWRALEKTHGATVTCDRVVRNPFHAPEWRQSGQIANDVYRKHTWALCGTFGALAGGRLRLPADGSR